MEFLCEFDFEIKHVTGKENKTTYTLIRKLHVTSINTFQTNLRSIILKALHHDEMYLQVREEL